MYGIDSLCRRTGLFSVLDIFECLVYNQFVIVVVFYYNNQILVPMLLTVTLSWNFPSGNGRLFHTVVIGCGTCNM